MAASGPLSVGVDHEIRPSVKDRTAHTAQGWATRGAVQSGVDKTNRPWLTFDDGLSADWSVTAPISPVLYRQRIRCAPEEQPASELLDATEHFDTDPFASYPSRTAGVPAEHGFR